MPTFEPITKTLTLKLEADGGISFRLLNGRRHIVNVARHNFQSKAIFSAMTEAIDDAAWNTLLRSGIDVKIDTRVYPNERMTGSKEK